MSRQILNVFQWHVLRQQVGHGGYAEAVAGELHWQGCNSKPSPDHPREVEVAEWLFGQLPGPSGDGAEEAAGIEPASIPDVNNNSEISCGNTTDPRAAPALHLGGNVGQGTTPIDTDLHAVIQAWPALPPPLRKAILGIVRSQEDGMSNQRALT